MGNGHGRLRGANALSDHRSRQERSSNQTRQLEARETAAIIKAETIILDELISPAVVIEPH